MATTTRIVPGSSQSPPAAIPLLNRRTLLALCVGVGVVLLALSGRHGYHVDELYNRATREHLAWGYVDQPRWSR